VAKDSAYKSDVQKGDKQKAHEEVLKIHGHKGNANQNHMKILPHSC
jgi:hypothetical protein